MNYSKLFTKRKDGRYQGHWVDADGVRHTVGGTDPKALYEKIQALQAPKAVTFREVAEDWEEAHVRKLERGTQSTYKAPIEAAINDLGDMPVKDITPADIDAIMLREKAQGYSYKHAALQKSIISQILDHAILMNKLTINPASSVKVPRGMPKGRVHAPTKTQTNEVEKHFKDPNGLFAAMLYYTGMRTEEVVALEWSDIYDDTIHVYKAVDLHGTPLIKDTKTENGIREIPIVDNLAEIINAIPASQKKGLIFNRNGKLLTRSMITTMWKNWCIGAGLATQVVKEGRHRGDKECSRTEWKVAINPHQFRHNFATVLFEAEVDELTFQHLLGHADATFSHAVYTSLREEHLKKQTAKLNQAFGGAASGAE